MTGEQQAKERAVQESRQLKTARKLFAPFLANNPDSLVLELDIAEFESKPIVVSKPWGDDSLALMVPTDKPHEFASALNHLYLPPRLTALYHKDTRQLEVIWTAFKLDEEQSELVGRKFQVKIGNKKVDCKFDRSSDRLLAIARNSLPLKISGTEFRNLRSFALYANKDNEEPSASIDQPISFWIEKLTWKDDEVVSLIEHINFFLRYYDSQSPMIVIHPKDGMKFSARRYLEDTFPSSIVSKPLNPALVSFYFAAQGVSVSQKFLNHYRIMEYVAYHHIETETKKSVKRIMSQPSVLHNIERAIDEVIGLVREQKQTRDVERLIGCAEEILDPVPLWREVCAHSEFFSSPTEFEGGLIVERLANNPKLDSSPPEKFLKNLCGSFASIRNALAHGKDLKTGKVIVHSDRNTNLLRPWAHLIALAAGQVVLYESVN